MRRALFSALALFLPAALCALSLGRVLSPAPGVWANRQCLFVDVKDGEECYYSLSGSDPLESGFVYDGPALLDVAGSVTLNVTVLRRKGGAEEKEERTISYTVRESEGAGGAVSAFVTGAIRGGVAAVSATRPLPIPEELSYSFWDEPPEQRGKTLLVRRKNDLSRYVPCTVSDGTNSWRFVLHVLGGGAGAPAVAGRNAPRAPGGSAGLVVAGRSGGNEPLTFSAADDSGLGGDGLSLMLVSAGLPGEEARRALHGSFSIDALDGEEISGEAVFEVFRGGASLGTVRAPFSIDRKKPAPPSFVRWGAGRGTAEVSMSAEERMETFFAVKGPLPCSDGAPPGAALSLDGTEPFAGAEKTRRLLLPALRSGRAAYRVFAYCVDGAGNKSDISSCDVFVEPLAYYFAEKPGAARGDGSRESPFTTAGQVLAAARTEAEAHFFLDGTLRLPPGESVIASGCSFSGTAESRIVIPCDGVLVIRGASVALEGLVIEKERGAGGRSAMFVLERSSVSLANCEVVGLFPADAVAFLARDSELALSRSGLTVQGAAYSCPVVAERSRVSVSSSRVSSIGETAVCFSLEGGAFSMERTSCRSTAHFGRIAELSGAEVSLSGNAYLCDFDVKSRNMSAIWIGGAGADSGAEGRFFGATMFR